VREGKSAVTAADRKLFQNVMQTEPDATGGFLVMPEELESSVRALMAKSVVMRRLANILTMTADRKIVLAASYPVRLVIPLAARYKALSVPRRPAGQWGV